MCRYSKTSDETACGCPDWVAEGINAPVNEGSSCASSNPYWTSLALPWLKYLKRACPTACECRKPRGRCTDWCAGTLCRSYFCCSTGAEVTSSIRMSPVYPVARRSSDACHLPCLFSSPTASLPTALSDCFPYDDHSSTFVCRNEDKNNDHDGKNSMSYIINFCPAESQGNLLDW